MMAEMGLKCFDKNGDNVLDKEEFAACIQHQGKE